MPSTDSRSAVSPTRRQTLFGLAALGFASTPALAQSPLSIVATTGMIADTAQTLGGDLVSVRALMGPGVDPHAYRQTRSDIVALSRADLVLWHGLYLEAQMEELFNDLSRTRDVVAVTNGLDRGLLLAHDDYADRFDPHVWMTPQLWANVTDAIAAALRTADPDNAATYMERTADYKAELERLAAYATEVLSSVPDTARVLVTAHDAFSYFGRDFGFEVLGIQGISTESEAGVQRIGELVDTLVERDIKAVFVESSVSDRSVRALIEGAAAQGHEVAIGGELYSDAMGSEGSYEGTYLGMIDHNVTTIARALGGTAPEAGRLGKLGAA
ncbi:metal ABC transporter solute-binding protein, Zn/Mn family [Flavimaricola marinus]|uniref:Periplasmic zinc-binding protein TroA n=1 Tax=Flavimaricola marinus TaxID=1819565 RepID=A0A238LIQ8_9RHOB|nr:zinc ABC transporter substrate-binding protein [Flavimaricola marinus]SMY09531.1 Periplasmic zinc-binding protein TroA precursor [Flavimaricola marinus]